MNKYILGLIFSLGLVFNLLGSAVPRPEYNGTLRGDGNAITNFNAANLPIDNSTIMVVSNKLVSSGASSNVIFQIAGLVVSNLTYSLSVSNYTGPTAGVNLFTNNSTNLVLLVTNITIASTNVTGTTGNNTTVWVTNGNTLWLSNYVNTTSAGGGNNFTSDFNTNGSSQVALTNVNLANASGTLPISSESANIQLLRTNNGINLTNVSPNQVGNVWTGSLVGDASGLNIAGSPIATQTYVNNVGQAITNAMQPTNAALTLLGSASGSSSGTILSNTGSAYIWTTPSAGGGATTITNASPAVIPLSGGGSSNFLFSVWLTNTQIGTTPTNVFQCTLTKNCQFPGPTNLTGQVTAPADGQTIRVMFIQDATGNRTLSILTSSNSPPYIKFGTDITGITLSTNANAIDIASFQYQALWTNWLCTGFIRGLGGP